MKKLYTFLKIEGTLYIFLIIVVKSNETKVTLYISWIIVVHWLNLQSWLHYTSQECFRFNSFEKVGNFFEKVGKFFEKLGNFFEKLGNFFQKSV